MADVTVNEAEDNTSQNTKSAAPDENTEEAEQNATSTQDGEISAKNSDAEEDWDLKVEVKIANPEVEGGQEHLEISVNNYNQSETELLFKVHAYFSFSPQI